MHQLVMLRTRAILLFLLILTISGCAHRSNVNPYLPKGTIWDAASSGDIRLLRNLVAKGADINAQHAGWGTPLHLAAGQGNLEVVRYLIDHKANINIKRNGGFTPLHVAAERDKNEIVSFLLSKGADVNAKDCEGNTPLHCTTFWDGSAIPILVSKGADINARNKYGATPLIEATNTAELLIRCGSDLNVKDKLGYTPLQWAMRKGNIKIAKLLITKGCKVDIFTAAGMDDVNRVKQLLKTSHNNINQIDGQGNTALHFAAEGGCVNVAKLLISQGANLNIVSGGKETPLHRALIGRTAIFPNDNQQGRLQIAKMLILAGADLNIKNTMNRTPLACAEFKGYDDIAILLIKHGAVK